MLDDKVNSGSELSAKQYQDHTLREKSYMLHAKPKAYKAIGRTRQVHHATLVLASSNSLETLVDTRFFNHVLTCSERTPSDTGALFTSHHRGANSVCRMFCIYMEMSSAQDAALTSRALSALHHSYPPRIYP
jgi:hypothetical protein